MTIFRRPTAPPDPFTTPAMTTRNVVASRQVAVTVLAELMREAPDHAAAWRGVKPDELHKRASGIGFAVWRIAHPRGVSDE